MEYKIIQVNNYLLAVVNDKKRGWFYCVRTKSFFHDEGEDVLCCNGDLSVEAHLPLNGANIIENLPLLPPLEQEDDVEELAWKYNPVQKLDAEFIRGGFKEGYKKAVEKYDDIITKLFNHLHDKMESISQEQIDRDSFHLGRYRTYKQIFDFIQSLSQPNIPLAFELEMVDFEVDMGLGEECIEYGQYPKSIINSDGIKTWVGKYIY